MALRYKRFYYDIDKPDNEASIFVDDVLVLKKVITFTGKYNSIRLSELFGSETRVFKVNSIMEFKNKADKIGKKTIDPLNCMAGRLSREQIFKIGKYIDIMSYLPASNCRLMSVTELKLNSLRKVVGDKEFVNETDAIPYTTPMMTCCYDGVDFQYKDANGELIRYFGKFFVIGDSGYILSAAYMKQPKTPKPFDLYALAAKHSSLFNRHDVQNVDICELSDIKFDDMLRIYKENAFYSDDCLYLFHDTSGSYNNRGFLISNIEKVDPTELDGHFSYRIKGRFIDNRSSNFISDISYGSDIGSAMDLKVDKPFVTLELGDIDDVKRVYTNYAEVALAEMRLLDGLFYVKPVELDDEKKNTTPIIWPVFTVYRQFMQFDRLRRKAIDDYIGNLSDEELACIGPDDKLFCVE